MTGTVVDTETRSRHFQPPSSRKPRRPSRMRKAAASELRNPNAKELHDPIQERRDQTDGRESTLEKIV